MSILGIHHLTAVCSNAQRTVDFYTKILGLKFVKKTVNFDDPGAYHLYFGDETGKPGTLITFFEWRDLPHGTWGIGTTHHLAFIVETIEALLKWKTWLTNHEVVVTGPYDRSYFRSIYFHDPDGLILEIATRGPGWTVDEDATNLGMQVIPAPPDLIRSDRREERAASMSWEGPLKVLTKEMKIGGLHHITAIASDIEETAKFYTEVLNLRILKKTINYDDPSAPHYYFGVGEGKPGTVITYFGYDEHHMRYGRIGTGMTHHFAFAVENEQIQLEWREKLLKADVAVTPVQERVYFKSIYFSDPDGHVLEIATVPPGFLIDEEQENLGKGLKLPPWLFDEHEKIENALTPLV